MDLFVLIAGGIVLLAIVIGLILIFHAKKKNKAIKHYEEIRDKLTLREKPKKRDLAKIESVVSEFDSLGGSLASLITGLVTVGIMLTVGLTIINSMGEVFEEASMEANITSDMVESAGGLIELFPLLMIVLVAGIVLSIVGTAMRSLGASTSYEEAKTGIEHYKQIRDKLTERA